MICSHKQTSSLNVVIVRQMAFLDIAFVVFSLVLVFIRSHNQNYSLKCYALTAYLVMVKDDIFRHSICCFFQFVFMICSQNLSFSLKCCDFYVLLVIVSMIVAVVVVSLGVE